MGKREKEKERERERKKEREREREKRGKEKKALCKWQIYRNPFACIIFDHLRAPAF